MKQIVDQIMGNDWEIRTRNNLILSKSGHVYLQTRVIHLDRYQMKDFDMERVI